MVNVAVLLLAGGAGYRMHMALPKQYVSVEGESVILHTMQAFQKHNLINSIYVVCQQEWQDTVSLEAKKGGITKFCNAIAGGETSFSSMQNGILHIAELEDENTVVMVHDSVRPLISQDIISRNIAVCLSRGNAITTLQSHESYMQTEDGASSTGYIPREKLLRAQTPFTFKLKELTEMIHEAEKHNINDSQSLFTLANELRHVPLYAAEGNILNFKLTTPADLDLYRLIVNNQE